MGNTLASTSHNRCALRTRPVPGARCPVPGPRGSSGSSGPAAREHLSPGLLHALPEPERSAGAAPEGGEPKCVPSPSAWTQPVASRRPPSLRGHYTPSPGTRRVVFRQHPKVAMEAGPLHLLEAPSTLCISRHRAHSSLCEAATTRLGG